MKLKDIATSIISEGWYHGTPDAREVEKNGGFHSKTVKVSYVEDLASYKNTMEEMQKARDKNDMDAYHKLLDKIPTYKKDFIYKKPLFLSNKHSVAKTYANSKRAFDYQNSQEKVYEVEAPCTKIVEIIATGDKFRFLNTDKVKKGFIEAGVPKDKIEDIIQMFNYYVEDNKGLKTDTVAAIGNYLDFDCIDVVGVLDSYMGGNVRSTVRMLLDPTKAKIIKHANR